MTDDLIHPYRAGPTGSIGLRYICNRQKDAIIDTEHDSVLTRWICNRVTNSNSVQDWVCAIQGKRGSGKSISALYLAWKLSLALSRKLNKPPEEFFSLENVVALQDTPSMLRLMGQEKYNQIYILDDASVGLNSRNFSTLSSKNAVALFTTMRTRSCIVILTMPLIKNSDLQIREFIDTTFTIYSSKHAGGFNLLKATSPDISTSGKIYNRRLSFDGEKIDFFVFRTPPKEMLDGYNIVRKDNANRMAQAIIEKGSYREECPKSKGSNPITSGRIELYEKNKGAVKTLYKKGKSIRDIMRELNISKHYVCRAIEEGE